jgi:hypothetical protein
MQSPSEATGKENVVIQMNVNAVPATANPFLRLIEIF